MSHRRGLPEGARLPLAVYRTFFPLVFLLMLPGFLLRMIRRGGYRAQFGQRFGRYDAAVRQRLAAGGWTWIHAVSVGEMMMALKLARAMQEAQPGIRLLLSTTTSTGYAVARKEKPEGVELIYYPLDLAGIVCRVLSLLRPERLVLVDKELWPNLVSECYRRGVPVSIVNARISPRSERRIRKARRWVAPFYGLLERVCLQDATDRSRWEAVGVRPEALRLTGSLKFDQTGAVADAAALEPMRRVMDAVGAAGRPVLLGGSTFPGEEALLGRALLALRERWPELFLILVPRHVERTPEAVSALEGLGLRVQLRSEPVREGGARPDVLVVDTTGELARWYAMATVCFIGKSMGPEWKGGQNPAEPLFAGKPVVFGPEMQNFEPLVTQLLAAEGAVKVAGEAALCAAVERLLTEADLRERQVRAGREVLAGHCGATGRIISAVF